jgi:thiosulfate/3-mercaptopyruvate sulfurtransferase
MTRQEVWRIYGVAVLSLAIAGWAGMASAAAKWANPELLVTPEEVKKNVTKADWVVVDCRDLADYAKGHIPGAISFGKKCKSALRDSTSRIFMDTSKYEKFLGKVGIGNDTHVILYHGDMKTITDVGVAFWILEYLGHEGKVHVLNGGLDAWRKAGNRLDSEPVIKSAKTFTAKVVPNRYSPTSEILEIAQGKAKTTQLVDSRTEGEYEGERF